MPKNEDAWQVYQAIQGQVIVAPMGGIIAINQLAIWEYIDHHSISNPTKVFDQVCRVAQEIINDQNEDAQIERDLSKAQKKT